MSLYPVFLDLRDARVVIVGGGAVAASKLAGLLAAGARVTVIAPSICAAIRSQDVRLIEREFTATDLDAAVEEGHVDATRGAAAAPDLTDRQRVDDRRPPTDSASIGSRFDDDDAFNRARTTDWVEARPDRDHVVDRRAASDSVGALGTRPDPDHAPDLRVATDPVGAIGARPDPDHAIYPHPAIDSAGAISTCPDRNGTVKRGLATDSVKARPRWVVAAATPAVNREVAAAAAARGLFVNAVDDKAAATAYLGGVIRRGEVTVAISTGGVAPALAGLLREALDAVLPDDLERWLDVARDARSSWKRSAVPMTERRPLLLRALDRIYGGAS